MISRGVENVLKKDGGLARKEWRKNRERVVTLDETMEVTPKN